MGCCLLISNLSRLPGFHLFYLSCYLLIGSIIQSMVHRIQPSECGIWSHRLVLPFFLSIYTFDYNIWGSKHPSRYSLRRQIRSNLLRQPVKVHQTVGTVRVKSWLEKLFLGQNCSVLWKMDVFHAPTLLVDDPEAPRELPTSAIVYPTVHWWTPWAKF